VLGSDHIFILVGSGFHKINYKSFWFSLLNCFKSYTLGQGINILLKKSTGSDDIGSPKLQTNY
jgi:hypothetical protein